MPSGFASEGAGAVGAGQILSVIGQDTGGLVFTGGAAGTGAGQIHADIAAAGFMLT